MPNTVSMPCLFARPSPVCTPPQCLTIAGITTNGATSKGFLAGGVVSGSVGAAAALQRAKSLEEEIKRQRQVAEDVKALLKDKIFDIEKVEKVKKQLLKLKTGQEEIKQSFSKQLDAIEGILTNLLHSKKTTEKILSETRAQIEQSITEKDDNSPYVRIARDVYALTARPLVPGASGRLSDSQTGKREVIEKEDSDEQCAIFTAFGMRWSRKAVKWSNRPNLFEMKTDDKTSAVDFSRQCGIYILYYKDEIVYVGRTTINNYLKASIQSHLI